MTKSKIERLTSDELIAARKELGLTQSEMATRLNTPLPTYKDWEYGHKIYGAIKPLIELILEKNRIIS